MIFLRHIFWHDFLLCIFSLRFIFYHLRTCSETIIFQFLFRKSHDKWFLTVKRSPALCESHPLSCFRGNKICHGLLFHKCAHIRSDLLLFFHSLHLFLHAFFWGKIVALHDAVYCGSSQRTTVCCFLFHTLLSLDKKRDRWCHRFFQKCRDRLLLFCLKPFTHRTVL